MTPILARVDFLPFSSLINLSTGSLCPYTAGTTEKMQKHANIQAAGHRLACQKELFLVRITFPPKSTAIDYYHYLPASRNLRTFRSYPTPRAPALDSRARETTQPFKSAIQAPHRLQLPVS